VNRPNWKDAVRASLVAGPVFLVSLIIFGGLLEIATRDPHWRPPVREIASLVLPAFIVGFLLALLPNLIATGVMKALSRQMAEFRRPLAWVAVGALLGGALAFLFGARFDSGGLDSLAAMAVTGGVCARICRGRAPLD
jgi:hypothetical protein